MARNLLDVARTCTVAAARGLVGLVLLGSWAVASADGRIYAADYTPEIADQRALIAFDGQRQVMLIENHVGLRAGQPVKSLGWVVPVPAVPEIAVSDAPSVRRLYRQVRYETDSVPWPVTPLILVTAAVAFLYAYRLHAHNHPHAGTLRNSAVVGAIVAVLAMTALSATPSGPATGVEVVKALRAGPLDAKVVRAAAGSELVDWLKQNGYAYGSGDVAAIEGYLRRKWLFVVTKLSPEAGAAFEGASASPPLVLSFPTREAVYPVALTAAGGRPLDLVLYVYAAEQVVPSVGMKTAYAGPRKIPHGFADSDRNEATSKLISALNPAPGYLTKLVKKLSPDEMRQDIRFAAAPEKGDFHERIVGALFLFWVGGACLIGIVAALLERAGGGERWRLSAPAWFMISMLISAPLALILLVGSGGQQYWKYRKERVKQE